MAAINLYELFNGRVFRTPDFQRGYAWLEKQLVELWDDIDELQEDDNGNYKKHYTGTIYLEEIQPLENERWLSGVKFYDVVDGQQRLTTISIFIFELLKLANNGHCGESKEDLFKAYLRKTNSTGNSTIYKFSYAHTNQNFNYLINTIFEDNSIILQNNDHNLYTKNLIKAKDFFADKLKEIDYAQREIVFKKLTTSLQFDIRTIEKDLDVQAVFETMNNRGKPLSTLEKLKNRLIYLTEKLKYSGANEDKIKLRNTINEAWGKIYNWLAKNPDYILDEDVFLSSHLSLYRKPKDYVFSENNAEDKVFQMFCNKSEKFDKDDASDAKEEAVSFLKIEDYVIDLSNSATVWYDIHNSQSKLLNKILLLNGSKEMKVFLLALFLKNDNKEKINNILKGLEKLLFRNRVPGIGVMDERTFATMGREVYSDEIDIDNINLKIQGFIDSPVLKENLIQSMNNLFSYVKGPKGFHRWWSLKYFLFEYEDCLKQRFKETNDKVSLNEFDSTTIEHVVPQNFENWSDLINDFNFGLVDEKRDMATKVIINTLGNLTILKDGKNSSLGNKSWIEKRNRFATGSYNEIAISQKANWTKKEIFERGLDMLDFLEAKVGSIKFTDEDRSRLLFYQDFIIDIAKNSI